MGKKILIADDEQNILKVVGSRLKSKGYDVILASNGQEALDMARNEGPDLIILDIMLPKIDGYKICALLKADARYVMIPVILFSAKAREEDFKIGKEVNADAYITKPFEPSVLLGKVRELLKE